jgi:hypothetical protein
MEFPSSGFNIQNELNRLNQSESKELTITPSNESSEKSKFIKLCNNSLEMIGISQKKLGEYKDRIKILSEDKIHNSFLISLDSKNLILNGAPTEEATKEIEKYCKEYVLLEMTLLTKEAKVISSLAKVALAGAMMGSGVNEDTKNYLRQFKHEPGRVRNEYKERTVEDREKILFTHIVKLLKKINSESQSS